MYNKHVSLLISYKETEKIEDGPHLSNTITGHHIHQLGPKKCDKTQTDFLPSMYPSASA